MEMELTTNILTEESQETMEITLPRGMRFLTISERLADTIFGCGSHDWGFPQTDKTLEYPKPFNSHETCTTCGHTRLYNAAEMTPDFYGAKIPCVVIDVKR